MTDYAAQILELEGQIPYAGTTIQVNGRNVTVPSIEVIERSIAYCRRQLAAASGRSPIDMVGKTLLKG